jgi:tripartite-type tricarboxylate transporter receptor subunit TctC
MTGRRPYLWIAIGALTLAALTDAHDRALAQAYPSRPITMIVPFGAGGSTDAIARLVADRMRVSLGQSVIVENVSSPAGTLGVTRAARAAPDGYTLSLGTWPTHVLNGALFRLPYDLRTAFAPVALIAANPQLVVARKDLPANDLAGLIAWLKANPGRGLQGATGRGSSGHVIGLLFQQMTGTRYEFIFYRNNPQQLQDLMAGRIDLMFDFAGSALPYARTGSIKVFAIAQKTRLATAPDIPTVDEAGLPGFHFTGWHGLWVPNGTPQAIIAKLNTAVTDALADPGVRQRLAGLGQEIFPRDQQTPEALAAFQQAEIDKWWPIIKAAGIKLDE